MNCGKHFFSSAPKVVSSAGKLMVSFLGDAKYIEFIDYLQTINRDYIDKWQCPGQLTKAGLGAVKRVHQNNDPAYDPFVSLAVVRDCFWTIRSPSLVYWCGTIWLSSVPWHQQKTHLIGDQHRSYWWWVDDVSAVDNFLISRIQALQNRWKKCVDRKRDDIDKYTSFGHIPC